MRKASKGLDIDSNMETDLEKKRPQKQTKFYKPNDTDDSDDLTIPKIKKGRKRILHNSEDSDDSERKKKVKRPKRSQVVVSDNSEIEDVCDNDDHLDILIKRQQKSRKVGNDLKKKNIIQVSYN